jgi:hypothetical protein
MADVTVIVCLAFDQRAPADGLQKFKDCIVHCPFVDRAMEVCGTFDLIVQGHCSSLAEYTDNMERVRRTTAQFVARLETSFVGRIIDRAGERTRSAALWLPCGDGRKRVESHLIDKIVAEGDYMRVHVADWSCLVHETMARLHRQLAHAGFVRLHRSWLVRAGFIERLIHQEQRWVARLIDGTHVRVAKSHIRDVLQLMTGESSTVEGNSPSQREPGEARTSLNEKLTTALP